MLSAEVAPGQSGGFQVQLFFVFDRPKSVKRDLMTVKPDVDKLCRAVLDAVSDSGFWLGDQQVVVLSAAKRYAKWSEPAGVWVTLRHAEEITLQ
jgi:Holliday junction resolvase RusA-like endonuclease